MPKITGVEILQISNIQELKENLETNPAKNFGRNIFNTQNRSQGLVVYL